MADQAIRTIPVKISWRSVIDLDISDPDLKKKTEAFLDKLERSAFKYEEQDASGKRTTKELSGQEMLQRMADTRKLYTEGGLTATLQQSNIMRNGKFVIAQHDRLFDGKVENGCNTAFIALAGTKLPVRISLGTDYLKGARYYDTGGRSHPVSIEGVLANELAHLAFRTDNDRFSNQIESIIVTAMGGNQRNDSEHVDFKRNGNNGGGYLSLLEKPPAGKPAAKVGAADITDDSVVPVTTANLPLKTPSQVLKVADFSLG